MAGFFFFRKSLGHDDVDRYNNTWAVFLFLLLSLLSLLMPLSPTLSDSVKPSTPTTAPSRRSKLASPQQQATMPKVLARCWTPAEFTNSYVQYANEYCADVANGLLNGVKSSRTLYELTDSADAIDELNLTSVAESRKGYFENFEMQRAQQKKNEEVRTSTRELVDFRSPVLLFLLALCLKLPYILWSLLSSAMTSGINVDQTLESCVESRSLDVASQKQIYEDTTVAVAESVSQSRNTSCYLYLLLKVLVVVVLFGETFFVSKYIVPDIQAMGMDFVENPLMATPGPRQDETTNQNISEIMKDPTIGLFDYPNNILRCGFKIRQFKATQKFIVQCMFTRTEEPAAEIADSPPDSFAPTTSTTIQSTLLLYQALFTVVLAFLAVLIIANVLNTVSWFLRLLVSSYATSMGLSSGAAKDVVLLVHMAKLNAGPRVARALAESPAWSDGNQETEGQPMLETKA